MAFQDFDQINERRKTENARKFRRRIIIAVVAVLLLAGIIVAAIVLVNKFATNQEKKTQSKPVAVPPKKEDPKKENPKKEDPKKDPPKKGTVTSNKVVQQMCGTTDYKDRCNKVLSNTKDPISKPTDVFKAAISGTWDEANSAFEKASQLKFHKQEDKKEFEDECKPLFDNAKEELQESMYEVGNSTTSGQLRTGLLSSWLSAVMYYQQSCIDSLESEDGKSKLKKTLEGTKELTSNSLAMISLLPELKVSGTGGSSGSTRRLLAQDKDGFPSWMTHEERRVLKKNDEKPTPNVTVAKDGRGNLLIAFQPCVAEALGDGFIAKSMGFRNTAGVDKELAVAARVLADRAIFLNCRFEGYKSTLYAEAHRQFYKSSVISGTLDIIKGDAAAIFQNCIIYLRKPKSEEEVNIITAQERSDKRETTGIVLHNCKIQPDKDFESEKSKYKSYLGRPMKEYARVIVMESTIEDVIDKEGWIEWNGDFAKKTLFYGEYNNKGSGSSTDNRVKWPGVKVLKKDEAMKFTVNPFLKGNVWLKGNKGVPVRFGLSDN